jgi:membrane-bound lytic murein transglycosylase B
VDFDGDGRKDIWKSPADVLGSMANYFVNAGWQAGGRWGQEARLPEDFNQSQASVKIVKPVSDWQALKVETLDGTWPSGGTPASIVRPSGPGGRAFVIYENFRVVLRYNYSTYYATAGGLLADRLRR